MRGKISVLYTLIFLLSVLLFSPWLNGQTCSCASASTFNPFDLSVSQGKTWRFELTLKHHSINDLVEGSEKVVDDSERRRTAQTLFFDARYALSSHISLRAVFSLVRQSRDVGVSTAPPVSLQGVGDSMILMQVSPLLYSQTNRMALSLGGGVKMPLGDSNAEIIGIASEDM